MWPSRMILFGSLLILSLVCESEAFPSCQLSSANETDLYSMPPPIFFNESNQNGLVLFSLDCLNLTEVIFVNISFSVENFRVIRIEDSPNLTFVRLDAQSKHFDFNLTVRSVFLGYSRLFVRAEFNDENETRLNFTEDFSLDFAVKRKSTPLDTVFTVIVIILVCVGTFLIGCRLNTSNLYSHLRRPIPILIGLFSQFLCLPLVSERDQRFHFSRQTKTNSLFSQLAFSLAKLTKLDSSTALGILATGSAPGGGASNMYTAMFSGDVDLSASMTFSSTILAFG